MVEVDSLPDGSPEVQERPEDGVFILPTGYIDGHGLYHSEVELAPVNGKIEAFLADLRDDTYAASVVTGLLARCIKRIGALTDIDASLVRNMLVSDRSYLMMRLREMTFGRKVDVILQCPDVSCRKSMDITLFLDEMRIERQPLSERCFTMHLSCAVEGKEREQVEFRLPTGADQEALASVVHLDEQKAIHCLLSRCIRRIGEQTDIDEAVIGALPESVRSEIEAKIQQLTPDLEIELEGVCPECQNAFSAPIDLTAFVMTEIRRNVRHLAREVHFVAWYYHWSEQDILALPRQKRLRYIELLQEEIERHN